MTALVAATGPSAYWYLTRGSGVVALVLLTASLCLGIAGVVRLRTNRLPSFAVTGLHRNLTLLSIVFVVFHVVTSVLDGYAPIGWKDAVVPFLSPYRPLWLGLGAVAFDLLLALVVTSLLRARLGIRMWRAVHWLAYVSWPVALVHSLGTGSDARAGWLQLVGLVCVGVVAGAVALRLARGSADRSLRLVAGSAAAIAAVLLFSWYRGGPGAPGWASRSGTPSALIAHRTSTQSGARLDAVRSFTSQFAGTVSESPATNGLVDVRIDGTLRGGTRGRLRLALQGVPLDDGGVSMTSSGVAFATAGSPVYEGHIVGLEGTRVVADVSSGQSTIALRLSLHLGGSTATGTVQARPL